MAGHDWAAPLGFDPLASFYPYWKALALLQLAKAHIRGAEVTKFKLA
jgi:hypothetical protein